MVFQIAGVFPGYRVNQRKGTQMQEFFASIGFLEPMVNWLFSGLTASEYVLYTFAFLMSVYGLHSLIFLIRVGLFSHDVSLQKYLFFTSFIFFTGAFIVFFDGIHCTDKYVQRKQAVTKVTMDSEEREIPVSATRYRILGTENDWSEWKYNR